MRSILFTSMVLVTLSCLSQSRRAPDWVNQPPLSEDAYYGVGMSNPEIHDNYRQQARQMALRDIAEKVIVSIDATSELKILSVNDQITYQLNESVAMTSSSFLSGYEQVGSWSHRKGNAFYVLYRLDKQTYQQNLSRYYDQFFELIDLKMEYAKHQASKGHLIVAINELAVGIKKLRVALEGIVDPTYAKMMEIKKTSVIHQLESYLTRIRFDLSNEYRVDFTEPNPLIITDFLIDHVTQLPVSNIPIQLTATRGDIFDYHFQHNTTHDALVIRGFFPVEGSATFRLKALIQLEEEVKQLLDPTLINRLYSSEVRLKFVPYPIQIVSKGQRNEALADYIRMITADLGLFEDETNAKKKVVIDISDRLDKIKRNVYRAEVAGQISVFDSKTPIPIYQYTLAGTSHTSTSRQQAIKTAYQDTLADPTPFLSGFVSMLCSK